MDIPSLLKSLNANNVRYVIIGATAFPVHGYSRATLDTDIFIAPTEDNAKNTIAALKEFGYDVTDLTAKDLLENKILIRGYIVETDVHPFVTGITDFESVWNSAVATEILGVPTHVADLDALIRMKEAAGRPKDIEDLKYLKKLKWIKPEGRPQE